MRTFSYNLDNSKPIHIDGDSLTLEDVVAVARHRRRVKIAPKAADRICRCRAMVEVLLEQGEKIYGLTTGFGKLRDIAIEVEDTKKLQVNLIRSHACGVGDPLPEDAVRAAMLLRANTLCKGNSGIRLEVVQQLLNMLNDDIYPYIPAKGSVGASGDLAPLSHLVLVLMGDPRGMYFPKSARKNALNIQTRFREDRFKRMPGPKAFEKVAVREGWSFRPVQLEAKEGLALNNGTQIMTAVGALACYDAFFTLRFAELAGAMSLEAIRGIRNAYDARIHKVRPQHYQAESAERVMAYCKGSQIIDLYLNTAHLYRARIHFKEAGEFLTRVERKIAEDKLAGTEAIGPIRTALKKMLKQLGAVLPVNKKGEVDGKRIAAWSAESPRTQIWRFHNDMLPIRQAAISALETVERESFPVTANTHKLRTSLVAAVDQLNKVVPDSPLIQDDYSFRCYPQVLGCAYRALGQVCETIEIEVNSATDNPLLFPPEPEGGFSSMTVRQYENWLRADPARIELCRSGVVGGGNFHGEPVAIAMDYLAVPLSEVASIAERRIANLIDESHSRGLPPFMIESSGLNSGFMVPQYTAAALVSENKVLAHPASVDSIPTCANTEDHVSMGTIAARKAAELIENVRYVVAIEILAAYQGLSFREPLLPGRPLRKVLSVLENAGLSRYDDDRVIYPDIARIKRLLNDKALLDCLLK